METKTDRSKTRDMAFTGMMTALICILGPLSLPVPVSPVPVSLVQLGIYLSIYILGTRRGTLSVILYVILGAAGLPVFSGFSGGFAKLMGPTGGYILGYVLMAAFAGLVLEKSGGSIPFIFAGFVIANALCYIPGTLWLSFQMGTGFKEALLLGVVPYVPADILKTLASMIICPVIAQRLKKRNLV